jgi:protein-disulfide isomerase
MAGAVPAVVLAVVFALVATSCQPAAGASGAGASAGAAGSGARADSLAARLDQSRIRGDPSARVWLIMVSDFQCPYCKQWHDESFAALEREYVTPGKVRLAFVNYPLPAHPNAWPAAEAAMCAGAQDKFWPMHDALFATQDAWATRHPPTAALDSIAYTVGVDTVAFDRCLATHATRPLIEADIDRGDRAGVRSTPTVIIGSKLLVGVQPIENYRHALDSALATSK